MRIIQSDGLLNPDDPTFTIEGEGAFVHVAKCHIGDCDWTKDVSAYGIQTHLALRQVVLHWDDKHPER